MSEPTTGTFWQISVENVQNEHPKDILSAVKEFFSLDHLMLLGFVMGPLLVCFLCCLPFYIMAYRRNREIYEMSPFSPLTHLSYHFIPINYPIFFMALLAAIVLSVVYGAGLTTSIVIYLTLILGFSISAYVTIYRFLIVLMPIRPFVQSLLPAKYRKVLTKEAIETVTKMGYFGALIKNGIFGACLYLDYIMRGRAKIPYYQFASIESLILIVSLVGFIFQVLTKSTTSTGHPEKVIGAQIKIIGAVKLVLFLAVVVCHFLEKHASATVKLFFLADLLLVPVAIMVTEIWFNENLTSGNVIAPCEVKEELLNI